MSTSAVSDLSLKFANMDFPKFVEDKVMSVQSPDPIALFEIVNSYVVEGRMRDLSGNVKFGVNTDPATVFALPLPLIVKIVEAHSEFDPEQLLSIAATLVDYVGCGFPDWMKVAWVAYLLRDAVKGVAIQSRVRTAVIAAMTNVHEMKIYWTVVGAHVLPAVCAYALDADDVVEFVSMCLSECPGQVLGCLDWEEFKSLFIAVANATDCDVFARFKLATILLNAPGATEFVTGNNLMHLYKRLVPGSTSPYSEVHSPKSVTPERKEPARNNNNRIRVTMGSPVEWSPDKEKSSLRYMCYDEDRFVCSLNGGFPGTLSRILKRRDAEKELARMFSLMKDGKPAHKTLHDIFGFYESGDMRSKLRAFLASCFEFQ